ncbi:transposase [Actinoplanes sp. NEAU-A12]|uniref:Transposase n=1 Tax=Actinoplanes sandaracinus TaxID=3045177 RepID=A0ABT6WY50_9ACTN|nr:transposase [Actinoplanes sandaracinus]MDI6104671.1 transposase [Actinoplanes sandaracinus]
MYRVGWSAQVSTHRAVERERRSFTERDYIGLIDAAQQQLDGPIVLIWDILSIHVSVAMREMIDARDWPHVVRLPAYAPDLNPVEMLWSHLKRGIGNLAVRGVDHGLRRIPAASRRRGSGAGRPGWPDAAIAGGRARLGRLRFRRRGSVSRSRLSGSRSDPRSSPR